MSPHRNVLGEVTISKERFDEMVALLADWLSGWDAQVMTPRIVADTRALLDRITPKEDSDVR